VAKGRISVVPTGLVSPLSGLGNLLRTAYLALTRWAQSCLAAPRLALFFLRHNFGEICNR